MKLALLLEDAGQVRVSHGKLWVDLEDKAQSEWSAVSIVKDGKHWWLAEDGNGAVGYVSTYLMIIIPGRGKGHKKSTDGTKTSPRIDHRNSSYDFIGRIFGEIQKS